MRTAALVLVVLVLTSASCARRYATTGSTMPDGTVVEFQPADVFVVYAAPTADAAAVALAEALRERGFTITEMSPGVMVADASSRRMTVSVVINYDERGAVIRYLHSDGMRVETSSGSRYYDTLTRRLSGAITSAVERPMRERADHELAMARAHRPVLASAPVAGVLVGGVAVGGGVVVGGGYVTGAPAYGGGVLSCEASVERYGYSRASTTFCGGADPWCADALLRTGHHPTGLTFCRGVEPSCAVRHLEEGRSPTSLSRCR